LVFVELSVADVHRSVGVGFEVEVGWKTDKSVEKFEGEFEWKTWRWAGRDNRVSVPGLYGEENLNPFRMN